MDIAKCRNCGSEMYHCKLLYDSYKQRVFVVECGDCRNEVIPVVVDCFEPEESTYTKFREAWNAANN